MKTKLLIGFLIMGLVLISGCVQEETKSVCGNGIVEPGEGCDGSGCPAGKVCTEKCKCEIPEIPSPPALPE